jgi:hypothetical protein
LRGGGEYYGRMLRMVFVAALPYGAAAIVAVIAAKVASRSIDAAVLESSAVRTGRLRDLVIVLAFWLAHVTLEAGRAQLLAEPSRKSALLAWWAGLGAIIERPGRMMAIAVVTGVSSMLVAAMLLAVRMRLPQGTGGGVLAAFVLSQLSVAALGWGRASGLAGMVDVARPR